MCYYKVQLLKKLQSKAGDGPVIAELKSQLANKMNALYHIKPLHHLATLLDPRMKTGVLSAEEKLDAVTALRKLLDEVPSSSSADGASAECEPTTNIKRTICCKIEQLNYPQMNNT